MRSRSASPFAAPIADTTSSVLRRLLPVESRSSKFSIFWKASTSRNSATALPPRFTWKPKHFAVLFYDRADFLGDPDFAKIPVAQLIDKKYAAAWRDSIDPNRASVSKDLKRPSFGELERVAQSRPVPNREPQKHHPLLRSRRRRQRGFLNHPRSTTASARASPPAVGFSAQRRNGRFCRETRRPQRLRPHSRAGQPVGAGKRPLSAMTPTIVVKDGKLFLVLGSPGGPPLLPPLPMSHRSGGFLARHSGSGERARFHNQWLPDEILVEDRVSPDTMNVLRRTATNWRVEHFWGDGECIMVDPKTGERLGASDGRNNGKA